MELTTDLIWCAFCLRYDFQEHLNSKPGMYWCKFCGARHPL